MTNVKQNLENFIQVSVSYPDKKNSHTASIGELKKRFEDETEEWRNMFFTTLLNDGVAFTKFGKYELLKISEL